MKSIPVGVQAMMLRESFQSIGAYETLKKVHALGYHSVEVSQIPMTAENVSEMQRAQQDFSIRFDALSTNVLPTGVPGQETLYTHFDKIVGDCKALNCSFLRIGMLPFDCMGSIEKVIEFSRAANAAAEKLAQHGIKLYYHNHHIEFRKFGGVTMLDIIRENAPLLGFELDVHWVHRGGYDPVKIIREYAGRVDLIHLKDYRIGALSEEALAAPGKGDFDTFLSAFKNAVQFAEVGEGSLDMGAIIEASLASGAKYFFIEQDELYGRDVFDCLKTSLDNLRKLGYEIA